MGFKRKNHQVRSSVVVAIGHADSKQEAASYYV